MALVVPTLRPEVPKLDSEQPGGIHLAYCLLVMLCSNVIERDELLAPGGPGSVSQNTNGKEQPSRTDH